MAARVHHVGIIVPSEEQAIVLTELLGLETGRREYVEKYQALCIFTKGEAGVIEWIVPQGGPLAKFNKGCGGIHHVAIEVESLDEITKIIEAKGAKLLEETPVNAGPIQIQFLSQIFTKGINIEFVERRNPQSA